MAAISRIVPQWMREYKPSWFSVDIIAGITLAAIAIPEVMGYTSIAQTPVITGLYTPDAGSFELGGKPYKPSAVHEVAKAGIARTFQNIRLFKEMSVLENLLVAQHMWVNRSMLAGILNTKGYRKAERLAECAEHNTRTYIPEPDRKPYMWEGKPEEWHQATTANR